MGRSGPVLEDYYPRLMTAFTETPDPGCVDSWPARCRHDTDPCAGTGAGGPDPGRAALLAAGRGKWAELWRHPHGHAIGLADLRGHGDGSGHGRLAVDQQACGG